MSKVLHYEVEFLSDVVLPASSNTEGNISQLDFIAGSTFLGMVATKYEEFENSFDMFHSSKVRFGDATILHNDKRTYKMPLSFFHEKLEKETLYNHHQIEDFSKFIQLKQKRKGYITEDLDFIEIDYNYAQKSAYDSKNRKSKDSTMFGYESIKKGSRWQFTISYVEDVNADDIELLKKTILGDKRLGKSKSSQYGAVNIKEISDFHTLTCRDSKEEVILYANGRLALIDDNARPTLDLKYLFEGLQDSQIVYDKCQIKVSAFTPYNNARKTKDYERVCIDKGSVIVLKDIDSTTIPKLVGAFRAEGFGELLVNPSFLFENGFSLSKEEKQNNNRNNEAIEIKSEFVKVLKQKKEAQQSRLKLLGDVDEFIDNHKTLYRQLNSSQWGTIRSICQSQNTNFREDIKDYISSGKVSWTQKQIDTLLDNSHTLEFIKLVSMQMPKVNADKGGNNE